MFMLAAVAIPILANGIRAWGTIYIASVTGSDFASGVDHVVYGWLFFAVVIALLMAAGWPFFDRTPGERWLRGGDVKSDGGSRSGSPWPAVLAAGLIAAAAPAWSSSIASSGVHPVPKSFELPEVAGWTRVPATGGRAWQPHFAGADALRIGRYRDETGRQVDLAVAVYARQSEGRELVGYGQGAVGPDSDWAWTATGSPPPQGRLDRLSSHGVVREVATFYRIGEIVTGRPLDAKLATIKTRLLGGPQRAVAVLISAEAAGGSETPRPAIDAFLLALGPIAPLADRAAGLPGRR
jgi:EpsI family protein